MEAGVTTLLTSQPSSRPCKAAQRVCLPGMCPSPFVSLHCTKPVVLRHLQREHQFQRQLQYFTFFLEHLGRLFAIWQSIWALESGLDSSQFCHLLSTWTQLLLNCAYFRMGMLTAPGSWGCWDNVIIIKTVNAQSANSAQDIPFYMCVHISSSHKTTRLPHSLVPFCK